MSCAICGDLTVGGMDALMYETYVKRDLQKEGYTYIKRHTKETYWLSTSCAVYTDLTVCGIDGLVYETYVKRDLQKEGYKYIKRPTR